MNEPPLFEGLEDSLDPVPALSIQGRKQPSITSVYLLLPQQLRIRDMMLTLDESHKGPSSGLYSRARSRATCGPLVWSFNSAAAEKISNEVKARDGVHFARYQ